MPYIQLRVAGKLNPDQKKAIAKEFADTLERIAQKPKNHTYLVIEEVDRDNWAIGEEFLSETAS